MKGKKKVSILGSTGSIGKQALDIIEAEPELYELASLSCMKNIELLAEQIKKFKPKFVATYSDDDARKLAETYSDVKFFSGSEGLAEMAAEAEDDILLNSVVGMAGLIPTYRALLAGKRIALANKETLVAGGGLIMKTAAEKGLTLLPVDSEHSAVFQCLQGNSHESVGKIILTASGGPFFGCSLDELKDVSLEDTLSHPTWNMGKKITVDSATMMNKGFEVIEAHWLFDIPAEKIEVLVHPESIIHSLVEYRDGAVMAQLGVPDMRLPIAYAFNYPDRLMTPAEHLDLAEAGRLTFKAPDRNTFKCLQLAYDALEAGNACCTALNAANEICVEAFLNKKIPFLKIQETLERVIEAYEDKPADTPEDILETDVNARELAKEFLLLS